MNTIRRIFVTTTFLLVPGAALAQETIVEEEMRERVLTEGEERHEGWKATGRVAVTASFNNAVRVVGVEDGTTVQLGGIVGGEATWIGGQHEWENTLAIEHALTKTPSFDDFIKSADEFALKSTYMYRLKDPAWLGFFGRLRLNTQLTRGDTFTTVNRDIRRIRLDGTTRTQTVTGPQKIALTSAFEPLTLRQTAGVFANPTETKSFTAKFKFGVGAQEIIARNGYVENDDSATPELDLQQIDSVNDVGLELEADLRGSFAEGHIAWFGVANVFQPLVTSSNTNLSTTEQINVDLKGGLSFKLSEWLSVDYVLLARRSPQVIRDWQIRNSLLLSAGFQII